MVNNTYLIVAPGIEMQRLREGLPYVHMFNISLHHVVNGQRQLINLLEDYEENIKTLVSEENIDVIVFDFLQRVRNTNYDLDILFFMFL